MVSFYILYREREIGKMGSNRVTEKEREGDCERYIERER